MFRRCETVVVFMLQLLIVFAVFQRLATEVNEVAKSRRANVMLITRETTVTTVLVILITTDFLPMIDKWFVTSAGPVSEPTIKPCF